MAGAAAQAHHELLGAGPAGAALVRRDRHLHPRDAGVWGAGPDGGPAGWQVRDGGLLMCSHVGGSDGAGSGKLEAAGSGYL